MQSNLDYESRIQSLETRNSKINDENLRLNSIPTSKKIDIPHYESIKATNAELTQKLDTSTLQNTHLLTQTHSHSLTSSQLTSYKTQLASSQALTKSLSLALQALKSTTKTDFQNSAHTKPSEKDQILKLLSNSENDCQNLQITVKNLKNALESRLNDYSQLENLL